MNRLSVISKSGYTALRQFVDSTPRGPESITIDDLVDAGCSIEDISRVIFETTESGEDGGHGPMPNFLPYVKLDQDGGIDRLDYVWSPWKYLWCFVLFAQAALNTGLLISLNWSPWK